MAKFLDGVRSGSSEAASTLRELGLSASQMLAASPEQQFALFADAIKSIQDPSLRVAAAMNVFGKGAAEIIPLLLEGSAGINAMVREAEDLGVVMSGETAAAAATTGWRRRSTRHRFRLGRFLRPPSKVWQTHSLFSPEQTARLSRRLR
jgi:hypothetical protein